MDESNDQLAASPSFAITRVFKSPRDRVWDAWSDPDQLGKWWGPPGCSVDTARHEFRAGGFFHYAMKFEGAPTMWGRFNFREIVPRQRIVWLNSFSNETCGIVRAPFSDLCPLEIENVVTISEQVETTKVVLQAAPFGAGPKERAYFAELCSSGSLEQGYGGTFDQLAEHLHLR